jgi:hypothetical protein
LREADRCGCGVLAPSQLQREAMVATRRSEVLQWCANLKANRF